jgi:hypothetical protein
VIERFPGPELYKTPPSVCTKASCGSTVFIPHEDGWQCFNGMKIIYKANQGVTGPSLLMRYKREKNRITGRLKLDEGADTFPKER